MLKEAVYIDGNEIRTLAPGFYQVLEAVGPESSTELFIQVKRWLATKIADPLKIHCLIIVLLKSEEDSMSEMVKLDDIHCIRFYDEHTFIVTEKKGTLLRDISFKMKPSS